MMKKKEKKTAMSMTPIKCHAFNKDRTQIALSKSDEDILIYEVEGTDSLEWVLKDTLKAHDMTVLSIDWGPKTNRIASCSEDRTAFVWEHKQGKWEPMLVTLSGATYAGLVCRWAPSENKFALGTGSGSTHICYYDSDNDWWISKGSKGGHSSSITSTEWMPDGDLIVATGSTDCTVSLLSAYIKPVDGKVANPGRAGTVVAKFKLSGWVHSLSFSPGGGDWLAVTSHDSSISFIDCNDSEYGTIETLKLRHLPFTTCVFVNENTCIAAGNDFYPMAFSNGSGEWKLEGKWIEGKEKDSAGTSSAAAKAKAMFQEQAMFGAVQGKKTAATKHKSAITQLCAVKQGNSYSFSSSGVDGQLNIWKASAMTKES